LYICSSISVAVAAVVVAVVNGAVDVVCEVVTLAAAVNAVVVVRCFYVEARIDECKNFEQHNVDRGQYD
jgi:phosphopantothenate synthetase